MRLLSALALLASSCASAPSGSPGPATVLPPAQEGMAPTPYTAEQIRWSHPVGASVTYVHHDDAGPFYTRMQWVAADEESCSIASSASPSPNTLEPRGDPVTTTWAELQGHASFSAEATTITREAHRTPAGDFQCWKYVVEEDDGSLSTYWFDTKSAGSPVEFTTTTADGEIVQRMELVEVDRRSLR